MSLRWCLQKDFIPSVIIGAKTVQQLEENMAAGTGWKLTDEEVTTIALMLSIMNDSIRQNVGLANPEQRSRINIPCLEKMFKHLSFICTTR